MRRRPQTLRGSGRSFSRSLMPPKPQTLITEALAKLGIHNFVLGIQDPSFPGEAAEDLGRGSPYSSGAGRLYALLASLGFNGVQLGPQGETSAENPSPYDSTLFSRSVANVVLPELATPRWASLLREREVRALVASRPGDSELRAAHAVVHGALHEALGAAFDRLRGREDADAARVRAELAAFEARHAWWLERDALYGVLCGLHQRPYWKEWPSELDRTLYALETAEHVRRREELRAAHHEAISRYAFAQCVVHAQHEALRARLSGLGLKLFGDLQIGRSPQDEWWQQALFLRRHRMGAPPSRTNPEGQDWNYPVMDPRLYRDGTGPALTQVRARMEKMLHEYDGVRLDHPHGLVCPWVYEDVPEHRLGAVRAGTRLFESPDVPEFAGYAIARAEQLDFSQPRHADRWVRSLEDGQVRQYAVLFDVVVEAARANGREVGDLVCEVLSTLPYPLQRVLERFGLGRFRVTQKVGLADPADVYRSENAQPADWIMLGNHDTRPIWRVVKEWRVAGTTGAHAAYLSERLCPPGEDRAVFAEALGRDDRAMAQAKFAELFASPAQNVMVFFADLFGSLEPFNVPGVVSPDNWSLRLPPTFEQDYARDLAEQRALDVPRALAMALRARGLAPELAAALATAR